MLKKDLIKKQISGNTILNKIIFFKEIESTNKFLKENDFASGTIVVAEKQKKGYGKLGAQWISPRGGLWFSFVINKKIKNPVKCLMAVAVAINETLKKYQINSVIKKPNDVFIDGKKVCGILIENDFYYGKIIIGIGINVNNNPPQKTNFPAVSLKQVLKKEIDLNKVFTDMITAIDACLTKDGNVIEKEWKRSLMAD
ncbi:MAG: biotin--[acetyl-CoA-carboxylase] ligase [Candidatus Goldbacteria bacterium]|nr:biotin--[acetyl-CoA-carboxylase] ligase [Candidatus Goldiibacteriota bacterium]